MTTLPCPDPECRGPHKAGQRRLRWQHTEKCKSAVRERVTRESVIDESDLVSTVVERARSAGAL